MTVRPFTRGPAPEPRSQCIMRPAPRYTLLAHAALAVAVAAILWRLRAFLPPHTLPARGDPSLSFQGSDLTPQWAPWLRVAIDTLWHQGALVFWNPFTNAGAPQFEAPEAGVLGLATLLGGLLPLEAAVKWAMLAHVVLGMLGVHALVRRLRISAVFAAVGAFSFGIGTYLLDHFRAGHLSHIEPLCLTPWAMLFLWNALNAQGPWWRHAIAAGIVIGAQVLEGASSVFVYTIVAFSLLVVTCIGPEFGRSVGRLVRVGVVASACFIATAGPQLFPMLSYIGLTGRAGGLSLAQSSMAIHEVAHPVPTVLAMAVMCLGFGWLVVKGQRRAACWLAAVVVLGIAAASVQPVYEFLWRYVPGFRYQRIPERALVMVAIAAPPLLAAGMEGAWNLLSRWRPAGVLLFSVGLAAFGYESWSIAPDTPPMADPRVERRENHAMRWLAAHAAGSRIHIWESPDRQWGADNITVPLGLESITSYTPSEHRDYLPGDFDAPDHRTFLGESYSNPARFWGMLNVRYILSTSPRAEPGLSLAAQVEPCPVDICQPAKSAGPYIYQNEQWLPRGWIVPHAIALVGPSQPVFEAALDVMRMPDFDPARMVVLHLAPGAAVPQVDGLFSVGADTSNALRWGSDDAQQVLLRLLRREPGAIRPATFTRLGNNRIEFRAPVDGWLVASEKLALYPGWSAFIDGTRVGIFRADGVLSAVRVGEGNIVHVSYEPRHFRLGVALLAVMLSTVAATELRYRRRGSNRSGPERLEVSAVVPR